MATQEIQLPKLCRHRKKNRAFVRLAGRSGPTTYLGPWGSAEARERYDQIIRQWLDNGRELPATKAAAPLNVSDYTVTHLAADYMEYAVGYYVKHGEITKEISCLQLVVRVWATLFPNMPVDAFGPKQMKLVREEMIRLGHTRKTINNNIGRLKRIVAWGVEEGRVKGETLWCLKAVRGLKRGRSGAKEGEKVRPVAAEIVDTTLPHLGDQVRAMVGVQRYSGMRPCEVVLMRRRDIDMSGEVWIYTPSVHKTEHHDIIRKIALGPKAQAIIKPFLNRGADAYLFSPAEAEAAFRERKRENRKTPEGQGNAPGSHVADNPRRRPGDRYTSLTYRKAIQRGCERAFSLPEQLSRKMIVPKGRKKQARLETPAEWSARLTPGQRAELRAWRKEFLWRPNQLRHAVGTLVRKQFSPDASQAVLGHQHLSVTEIYSELNVAKAAEVMAVIG